MRRVLGRRNGGDDEAFHKSERRPMEEDLSSVLVCLAAIGFIFGAIAIASVQPDSPPKEFDHPRPEVRLRPPPLKAKEVRATRAKPEENGVTGAKHTLKEPKHHLARKARGNPRTSKEAANAHAEELPAPVWPPMDIH